MAKGMSNFVIGDELSLSGATVKTYVSRLLTKSDLRGRMPVEVLAYERDWFSQAKPLAHRCLAFGTRSAPRANLGG